MNIRDWDERYRWGGNAADSSREPAPLVAEWEPRLPPGEALDLASGSGRNAVFLAERGWRVTAVDGSAAAMEMLKSRSSRVAAVVADLEKHEFEIEPGAWDLILMCCYLQRDLFPAIRSGVRHGGVAMVIVHIPNPGEDPTEKRAAPGELRGFFEGWEILHDYEGPSRDACHRRPVAEIVARKT